VGSHVAVRFSVKEKKAKVPKVNGFDLCISKNSFSLRDTAALNLSYRHSTVKIF